MKNLYKNQEESEKAVSVFVSSFSFSFVSVENFVLMEEVAVGCWQR